MPIRDKKKRNEKLKAWREKNPDRARAHELKRRYDITPERFDELLRNQHGVCAVCGNGGKLCIDHDHATGEIRGLLCHGCNLILGHAKDSIEVLEQAVGYLKRFVIPTS